MVKITAAACALLVAGSASAYTAPNRSALRSLGTKSMPTTASRKVTASMKMEGKFPGVRLCLSSVGYLEQSRETDENLMVV